MSMYIHASQSAHAGLLRALQISPNYGRIHNHMFVVNGIMTVKMSWNSTRKVLLGCCNIHHLRKSLGHHQ